MAKKFRKLKKIFLSLIVLAFIAAALFVGWQVYLDYNSIENKVLATASGSVSGGRITLALVAENGFEIEQARLNWWEDENNSINTTELSLAGDQLSAVIDTSAGTKQINYYFSILANGKEERLPSQNNYQQILSVINETPPQFAPDYIAPAFSDFAEGKINQIQLKISADYPTGDLFLHYRLSKSSDFIRQKMQFQQNAYQAEFPMPEIASILEYYFEIKSYHTSYNLPAEQEFISLPNPKFQELEDKINQYAAERGYILQYTVIDEYGNQISLKGDQEAGAVSVIKFWIMAEVYNQLESGKIKSGDRVSRYNYSGSVASALEAMMINSSNEAAGALLQKVGGPSQVNALIEKIIGSNAVTHISHTPGYPDAKGENDVATNESALAMQLVYEKRFISENASNSMLALMERCSDYFSVRKISGIDSIAMKTGYYPPYLYGLLGSVTTSNQHHYVFAIYFNNWDSRKSVKLSAMADVLGMINELYANY